MATPDATGDLPRLQSPKPDGSQPAPPNADPQRRDDEEKKEEEKKTAGHNDPGHSGPSPAVRFASAVEEISPSNQVPASTGANETSNSDPIDEVMSDQIKELSSSLRSTNLHGRRFSGFAYEPYSLPASRVPSREDVSGGSTRVSTPNRGSPRMGPSQPMQTPPLTPAGSDPNNQDAKENTHHQDIGRPPVVQDSSTITPQASSSRDATPPAMRQAMTPRSYSSDHVIKRADEDAEDSRRSHRRAVFDIGPGGSTPVSRESSPSRASQLFSKPKTPQGDMNDPYAANKRQPQVKNPDRKNIESRFQFNKRRPGHGPSPSSSSTSIARSDKRHSSLFGGSRRNLSEDLRDDGTHSQSHSRQSSFADLKRFFNKGGNHNHQKKDKDKKLSSQVSHGSGLKTSMSSHSGQQRQPFGEDHGLASKYGKLGKVLGSGAGGKVRLMKRQDDGLVFAVKEFRERYSYETQKEYIKRLTAEFCVGSTLQHGNIIETLDIVQEKERWYQVMEYAPYDLFAIVMTGKMSRAEISCSFLQILNGVTYLHSVGLAHRDLKLDNVVVSDQGIMKIIDFGSSHVFKYPFESNNILASGIVGSDPYLAPEVLTERKYDAQGVDIWSLAIIFCCMSLRRFPWKVPKMTDNSFKLFAAEPTPGHDPKKLALPSRSTNDLSNTRGRDFFTSDDEGHEKRHDPGHGGHRHLLPDSPAPSQPTSRSHEQGEASQQPSSAAKEHEGSQEDKSKEKDASDVQASAKSASDVQSQGQTHGQGKEIVRGPWRVLRVLPRESRHIIGRMLTIKTQDRATVEEITQDAWVANSEICSQLGPGGPILLADNHAHVLELPQPPANAN